MSTTDLGPALLELRQASKQYRANGNVIYAVRDANLALQAGSFTAIVGRSGCGKSTLLSLAGAVDVPTSGEVRIEARSTSSLSDAELSRLRRTRIGFVFQFFYLLPTLTVAENVRLPLLLEHRTLTVEQERHVQELLEAIGLTAKAGHLPHQLSGGEMQRAALARAVVHRPPVVIADEPTGNLDSINATAVLDLLRQLCEQAGSAVLMATHSAEAARFASRIIEMRDGKVLNE